MKKCVNCDDALITEEGIYCEILNKWVSRSSEQTCVIEKPNTSDDNLK